MNNDIISINIEINADEAIGTISKLLGCIDSGKVIQRIGSEVAKYSMDRITSRENRAPDGSRWEPLSAKTILRKQKKYPHQGTLQQENSLSQNIRADKDRSAG